jgi:signal transduction histidine kinase
MVSAMTGAAAIRTKRRLGRSVVDIGPALALSAFILFVGPQAARAAPGARDIDALGLALLGAAALPMVRWQQNPAAAFAGSLALTALYLVIGYPTGPIVLAPFAALLTLIARQPGSKPAVAAAAGALVLPLAQGAGAGWTWGLVLFGAAWLGAAGLFAAALRSRRAYLAEVRAREAWEARTREEAELRARAEDRLRLARDMHDGIGHSLAVIAFQAGVAEHLLDGRSDEVRRAVGAIRMVAKEALAELRSDLGQLRSEDAEATADSHGPNLSAVPELVGAMRDAGLEISYAMDGDPTSVPPALGGVTYRIVQEALTNIARHAGVGANAEVRVTVKQSGIEVHVLDTGRGAQPSATPGHGLQGMSERAAAVGGRLEAGNGPDGGFRVRAFLPRAPE